MSRFVRIDDAAADERTAFFVELLPEELRAEKKCRLIGAVDENGIPEGVVAFSLNGNMADILHVEVYRELRRKGIGTAMIRVLLKFLASAELPFVLQAVYSADGEDGDDVTDAFFRSLPDFEVVSGGRDCTVTPDTLWDLDRLKLLEGHKCAVTQYTELSVTEKNRLIKDLEKRNMRGFINFREDRLIPDLSLCHMENGKCMTCVIFTKALEPHTLELAFLMSLPEAKRSLAGVLNEVVRRYKERYPEHRMVFSLVNKESRLLARHFFPEGLKAGEILTAVSFGEV